MRTNKTFSLFSLAATCILNLSGQQVGLGPTPLLSPVPVVVAGEAIPSDSKQYVFLGPKVSQLTIAYPAGIDAGRRTGAQERFTVKMLNQVRPIVSTTVTALQDGTFEYVYSIRNDSNALDPIKVLALGLPATDVLLSAASTPWVSNSESGPGHNNPLPGAISMTPVLFSTWRDTSGLGIAPGQSINNIKIRSAYSPGFTLLYARSNEDYDVKVDLPAAVQTQLEVMRAPEWRNRALLVIGPVYPKVLPRDFVANEFGYGVGRLINSGQLTESSVGVAAIKNVLESVSRSGTLGTSAEQLRASSQTALESELINAILLSVR